MTLKHSLLILISTALLAGCDHENQPADQPITPQDVKNDSKKAFDTTRAYAAQSREEFVAAASKKLKDLDAKIDDLSRKSADYKDEAKVKADQELAALREDRDAVAKKFDALKQSPSEAWDDTKAAFSSAWDKVEKAYDDTKAKFN